MKSSYISILFVFVTFIAAAQSTKCNRCWAVGDKECCGNKTVDCPGSECMTISEYCKLGDTEYSTIRKTCGNKETCGICFSVTTDQGAIVQISTQCGSGDRSNAKLDYKITCEALKTENGLKCPACYNGTSMDGCTKISTVNCRGAETECVDYRGEVQLSDGSLKQMSMKGCTIKKACEYKFAVAPGVKETKQRQFTCTPAYRKCEN